MTRTTARCALLHIFQRRMEGSMYHPIINHDLYIIKYLHLFRFLSPPIRKRHQEKKEREQLLFYIIIVIVISIISIISIIIICVSSSVATRRENRMNQTRVELPITRVWVISFQVVVVVVVAVFDVYQSYSC